MGLSSTCTRIPALSSRFRHRTIHVAVMSAASGSTGPSVSLSVCPSWGCTVGTRWPGCPGSRSRAQWNLERQGIEQNHSSILVGRDPHPTAGDTAALVTSKQEKICLTLAAAMQWKRNGMDNQVQHIVLLHSANKFLLFIRIAMYRTINMDPLCRNGGSIK